MMTTCISSGAGATFGEVALISEDCVRTASIITDEPSDVIVIDRQLYKQIGKGSPPKGQLNFVEFLKYFHINFPIKEYVYWWLKKLPYWLKDLIL